MRKKIGISKLPKINNIYCVGRNYVAHAKELNNKVPTEPVIFTKSTATITSFNNNIFIPKNLGRLEYEAEIAIMINDYIYNANDNDIISSVKYIAFALDLTLRDKQTSLKQNQYPWDLAKSFINSCPLSKFIKIENILENIEFSLTINGKKVQHGNTKNMIFSFIHLIKYVSNTIPLYPGDLILTGTPKGVGQLNNGDELTADINGEIIAYAQIIR